jgi:hypothetical protein
VSARRRAALAALTAVAVAAGAPAPLVQAQGMSGTWLQCRDAAVSENGGAQRPDPGFEEILVVHLPTGSVASYDAAERSLVPLARGAANAGPQLHWEVVRREPTGQCTFVSSTQHTLQRTSLRYATENAYTMVCRDKAPLTHVTRRDATCRPIEALPLSPRKL